MAPLSGGSRGWRPMVADLGRHRPLMGSAGLIDGPADSINVPNFLFCYFINRGGHPNHLEKGPIYRDLSSKAFWMSAWLT